MASRVFDTYIPGSEEHLVSFINFINNGRVLCMAVQVSRSCQEEESSPGGKRRAHWEGRGELTGREEESSLGGKRRAHREGRGELTGREEESSPGGLAVLDVSPPV